MSTIDLRLHSALRLCAAVLGLLVTGHGIDAHAQENGGLRVESKMPLGRVAGRIDHMAVDLAGQRLFIAELGNNTVGVVDLKTKTVVHRIAGLSEPQGVAYLASNGTLYVANAGDGSVR